MEGQLHKKGVPVIPIELDKPRRIKLGFNAIVLIEQTLTRLRGERVTWNGFMRETDRSVTDMRVLLWAGLLWDDPNLTQEQLGNILDDVDENKAVAALQAAIQAQMPQKQKDGPATEGDAADAPLTSTGNNSGESAGVT